MEINNQNGDYQNQLAMEEITYVVRLKKETRDKILRDHEGYT
jgi:hypothetical protein